MRKFYYFKLCQAVLTFVILWQILSTEKLCGMFAEPKCFINSAAVCNNKFTIFKLDSETSELEVDDDTKLTQLNDHPTGEGCLPINISIISALRNGYNCVKTNQLENTSDVFARVLYLSLLFLVTLIFHALVQEPSEEYDLCGYLCVAYNLFVLSFSTISTILASVNWTTFWECTNFRPYESVMLVILLLSVILLCSAVFEMFFNSSLLKGSDAIVNQKQTTGDAENEQKQTSGDVPMPKISAVKGLKNDAFTVRAVRVYEGYN